MSEFQDAIHKLHNKVAGVEPVVETEVYDNSYMDSLDSSGNVSHQANGLTDAHFVAPNGSAYQNSRDIVFPNMEPARQEVVDNRLQELRKTSNKVYNALDPIEGEGTPVIQFTVIDRRGVFKQTLDDLCAQSGTSIIPDRLAHIPSQITEVDSYYTILFGTDRFFCKEGARSDRADLVDFCNMIADSLNANGYFSGTLMEKRIANNEPFVTLKFNREDLRDIFATFREWNPTVVGKGNELILTLGMVV